MTIGLEARSLTKRFSHLVAVDEVDLEVHAGQVTALLGRNGAGKTTLLRLLSTLIAPSSDQLISWATTPPRRHTPCAACWAGWVSIPRPNRSWPFARTCSSLAGSAASRSPI